MFGGREIGEEFVELGQNRVDMSTAGGIDEGGRSVGMDSGLGGSDGAAEGRETEQEARNNPEGHDARIFRGKGIVERQSAHAPAEFHDCAPVEISLFYHRANL